MIVSAAGAETAIKALRAGLQSDAGLVFEPEGMDGAITRVRPEWAEPEKLRAPSATFRCKDGYRVLCQRLGYGTWHLVAVARKPGLVPAMSEPAMYRELRSSRFTTPFLRAWIPWLAGKMVEHPDQEGRQLVMLPGFQVHAGLINMVTEEFDALVTRGLQSGELKIPERKESAA